MGAIYTLIYVAVSGVTAAMVNVESWSMQVSIDERLAIVEERTHAGDWELDTIIGKNHKQAIVTMTEQAQRLICLCKFKTKGVNSVEDAIVNTLEKSVLPVLTLTADNCLEFGNHVNIARRLEAAFCFAHPYRSWERGANENSNGLVRQHFPKGSDFTAIITKYLRRVERRLNNRARKCPEMKTPNEVVFGLRATIALGIGKREYVRGSLTAPVNKA